MKIIDAHIHTNFKKKEAIAGAKKSGVDYSLEGLRREMKENNVIQAVSITDNFELPTPIALDYIGDQIRKFPSIIPCVAINPDKIIKNSLSTTESAIKSCKIKALKIYLGYYSHYANDKIYHPFYKLAAKYKIPVIIHTGDTLLQNAKLKYSLPITVDEVAVDFRKTNFIIAHIGNPWVEDAAEVVYKNPNVYADLSGLYIGESQLEKELIRRLRNAYAYIEDPSKLLYGTDWPLARMDKYIAFIKKCVPAKDYDKVFYSNAKRLFKL